MSHVVNPEGLHNPVPFGYSHTAAVPAGATFVFVAGQYASDADGRVASPAFAEQVGLALRNLRVAVGAHGLDLANVVQLRTYVVDHDLAKLGLIAAAVAAAWGSTPPPPHTVIGVAALATPDILFEVEAVAALLGP